MSLTPKETIKNIVDAFANPEESLIAVLQKIQGEYGYISKESVEILSELTGISASRILGVASFYAGFRLKPVGKYKIMVCMGTACHVNGASRIGEAVERFLGIPAGDVTEDGLFSWEQVACLGCCSISPAMMINGVAYGNLTGKKVEEILAKLKEAEESK